MNKRFCFSFPRLVFFVIGATLFVLGLSACATSPVTPTVLSGVTTGNHKVELIFKTAVIAGSNDILVKVNAASGEPLRHTDVRLKVDKRAPIATATNTHDTPGTKDHESAKVDPHASPKVESHDDVKKKDDHEDDAGHDLTASSIAGEYVGQLNLPEAGEWLVTVHFMADGAEKEAAFAVTANRDWGKFAVLSGFLGVNVAVIAAAAITKGKFVKGTQIKETRS